MMLTGALVIVQAWRFAGSFSANDKHKFWAVTQIYPDLLAGAISLAALYGFLTVHQHKSRWQFALLTTSIALLPWLQIKFAATAAILTVAISVRIFLASRVDPRSLKVRVATSSR